MKRLLPLASITLLIFASCKNIPFAQTGELFPEYNGIVTVFHEEPDMDYKQIGILSSVARYPKEDAIVISDIQQKAAKKGANAIFIISFRDYPPSYYGNTVGTTKITAMAIRIPENTGD